MDDYQQSWFDNGDQHRTVNRHCKNHLKNHQYIFPKLSWSPRSGLLFIPFHPLTPTGHSHVDTAAPGDQIPTEIKEKPGMLVR